ncbi:MAG TPA: NAD(P)/FAD-dependent oxidoreductase [Dehalococcoidia bacterium]
MAAESFDVIVIGARCAGSSTARLLADGGLRVLVLDKATFPSDTVSTPGMGDLGVKMLQKWGLLEEVRATGAPHEQTVGVKYGDEPEFEREIPPGSFAPFCPRRSILDAILIRAATEAGAEIRERAILRDLIWEDGTVVGLLYEDEKERRHEARARLVIGADGINSQVAKLVGAEAYDVRPSRSSFRFAYYSGIPIKRVELAWSHPVFVYVFPSNDDLACMAVAVNEETFRAHIADGDDVHARLFAGASPRLAEAFRAGKRETMFYSRRGRPGKKVQSHGPGWALVGDAGFFKDPVTGNGIKDAFVGAQLLSDAVLQGFKNPDSMQRCLAQYQSYRDELGAEVFAGSQKLASLEWTNEELPSIHQAIHDPRERAAELLGLPLTGTTPTAAV